MSVQARGAASRTTQVMTLSDPTKRPDEQIEPQSDGKEDGDDELLLARGLSRGTGLLDDIVAGVLPDSEDDVRTLPGVAFGSAAGVEHRVQADLDVLVSVNANLPATTPASPPAVSTSIVATGTQPPNREKKGKRPSWRRVKLAKLSPEEQGRFKRKAAANERERRHRMSPEKRAELNRRRMTAEKERLQSLPVEQNAQRKLRRAATERQRRRGLSEEAKERKRAQNKASQIRCTLRDGALGACMERAAGVAPPAQSALPFDIQHQGPPSLATNEPLPPLQMASEDPASLEAWIDELRC